MRVLAKIVWSAVLISAVAFGVYRFRIWQKHNEDRTPKFETTRIDRGPIVAKVTASGTLSALVTVQVGSQVSGRISELRADFNSSVKKGQLVARIDPRLFMAALEQSRANANEARGSLDKAKVDARIADLQLDRQKSLLERKLIAQADFDTAQATSDGARAEVATAQANLEQANASLHQAQLNVEYTTIESPIDGVVISRSVDVGQTVAASLQAPILFTIAEDLRKMQVDTSVAEADVGKLEAGMIAAFNVDAYPTERFEGHVRQIRNAATTVQNVVTYDAVIDVSNPQLKLRPGMTANVTFVHANRNDALRVPNAALRYKPAAELHAAGQRNPTTAGTALTSMQRRPRSQEMPDRRTVYVLRKNRSVAVPVKIGITDGTHTEIVEGQLEAGEEVITDVAGGGTTPGASGRQSFRRIL
jgi:HlyD family secretion protein